MLYMLSKLIPVPMRSTYGVVNADGTNPGHERATWVQWRGHIWRHRIEAVA